jgi:hypothetical protein
MTELIVVFLEVCVKMGGKSRRANLNFQNSFAGPTMRAKYTTYNWLGEIGILRDSQTRQLKYKLNYKVAY